ncbi:hypothetical protein QFZ51_001845 [Chitinophaga sp. W3I9]
MTASTNRLSGFYLILFDVIYIFTLNSFKEKLKDSAL